MTWDEQYEVIRVKQRASWTRSHLKRMGWTPESVAAAKIAQAGLCAICNRKRPIFPDHRHGTTPPKPRALLCRSCNSAIGMLSESPDVCESAARYLRHWNKPCDNCGACLDCLREERER
jgi:Recombination endonuclease VII